MNRSSSHFDALQHFLDEDRAFAGTIATTTRRPLPVFVLLPWSTCMTPKSWGAYSPCETALGVWVSFGFDDGLGTVDADGKTIQEGERNAEKAALAMLRRQDPSPLSTRQLATRARALSLLVERVEGTAP